MDRNFVFTLAAFAFFGARAFAADPFINILGGSAPVKDGFYYSAEDSASSGSPIGPNIFENRIRSVNLISKDDRDTWGSQATASSFHFSNPVTFNNTGLVLPTNFYDLEAGGVYKRAYEFGRELSVSFSIGSDSDVPFYSFAEAVFQSTATYRLPNSKTSGWFFLVNLSNNRTFLNYVPIPGAVYYYRALDGSASYSLGFPFLSGSYELIHGLTAKAAFIGISQATVEINQKLGLFALMYVGYDWGQRVWLRVGRDDAANRLFFDQQKVSLGLRTPLSSIFILDLSGGYVFARNLFEAHSYYSSPEGVTGIDSAFTAQVMIGLRPGAP